MSVTLAPLPYAEDALEPIISAETIRYHYGKHHQGYVNKLNALIEGSEFDEMTLPEIVAQSDGTIFNNAAQAWNHEFYWNCMTPDPIPPSSKMQALIERDFGSFDAFKETFLSKASTLFGSGWCWLELDTTEQMIITQRSNADTPIAHRHKALLCCDVWEHAYYIDYRNERARYLERWFETIDWRFVASNIIEYYHDLTEPCKENSELCDYIDKLQEENEVRT